SFGDTLDPTVSIDWFPNVFETFQSRSNSMEYKRSMVLKFSVTNCTFPKTPTFHLLFKTLCVAFTLAAIPLLPLSSMGDNKCSSWLLTPTSQSIRVNPLGFYCPTTVATGS